MQIGIFGATGPAGSALGVRLASVGYDVVVGSRSHDRAIQVADELRARWPDLDLPLKGADNEGAAAAEVVIVATPWDSAATTAQTHRDELRGKVVVSMANALTRVGGEFQPLIPPRGSVAAHVQAAVPDAKVVAAFHHLPARELANLARPMDSDVLVCGDDAGAVSTVMGIANRIIGCRALNVGELSAAMAIESFTAVLLQLNVRYKTRVAPRLNGIGD
jgi:8-hydroxy-5-deazaflavin:NADPH oxidoreductase